MIRKNRKSLFLTGGIAAALIATAVVTLVVWRHFFYQPSPVAIRPMNDISYTPSTDDDKAAVDDKKASIAAKQPNQGDPQKNTDQATTSPQQANSLSVTIIRAEQSAAGQPLNVRVLVEGATSGSCQVVLSQPSQPTISKDFPVSFEATSASCPGIDIAASDFSAAGEWKLAVTARSGSFTSAVATRTVRITK